MRASMLLVSSGVNGYSLLPAAYPRPGVRSSVQMAVGGDCYSANVPRAVVDDIKMFQGFGWTQYGVEHDACDIIYTSEPVEDPMYSCWLVDNGIDGALEYQCMLDHPCIDFEDKFDHSDDSY